jgi:hypothetical protein
MMAVKPSLLWRLGAFGLFGLLPLLLFGLSLGNMIGALAQRDEMEQQRELLSTIVGRLARHHGKDLSVADVSSLYLTNSTESLALAELQSRAASILKDAGGHLNEAQPVENDGPKQNGLVGLQMSFDIDNQGLFDFLYAAETGLPLLTVTDLSVRRDEGGADGDTSTARLHVDAKIAAHFRTKGS